MSLPQGAEISLAYADFLANHVGVFDDIRWGPAYSTGTRVFAKENGVWRAFLLTDLTAPARFPSSTAKVERMGESTVTIAANGTRGTAAIALSPALPDSVLTNYLIFANIRSTTGAALIIRTVRATITSTVLASLEAFRNFNTVSAPNATTGVTVAGAPLTSVSGMGLTPIPNPTTVGDAHGGSDSFFDHAHDTIAHTVSDPQHSHAGASFSNNLAAETYTVDWMILHV